MADEPIPAELRDFISRSIYSVAHLETLLLLHASQQPWTADAVARRLYTDPATAAEVLAQLESAGLLAQRKGQYGYHCTSSAMRRMVDLLALTYTRHLIPITSLIHARPPRISEFANAFKFRKDKP